MSLGNDCIAFSCCTLNNVTGSKMDHPYIKSRQYHRRPLFWTPLAIIKSCFQFEYGCIAAENSENSRLLFEGKSDPSHSKETNFLTVMVLSETMSKIWPSRAMVHVFLNTFISTDFKTAYLGTSPFSRHSINISWKVLKGSPQPYPKQTYCNIT